MLTLREKVGVAILVVVIMCSGAIWFLSYQKGREVKALCDDIGGVVVQTKDGVYVCVPRRARVSA